MIFNLEENIEYSEEELHRILILKRQTAYNLFCKTIYKDNNNKGKVLSEISKQCSDKWKALTPEERNVYR
jgi:hypothetical protein